MKNCMFPTLAAAAAAMAAQMALPSTASAHPTVVTVAGVVTEIDDIRLYGELYDVTFMEGSCRSIFTECGGNVASFAFSTRREAERASNVLANILTYFDEQNSDINISGCGDLGPNSFGSCSILTPFAVTANVAAVELNLYPANSYLSTYVSDVSLSKLTPLSDPYEYAVWTEVPEPISAALFGVGVAAAGGVRGARRKKKPL